MNTLYKLSKDTLVQLVSLIEEETTKKCEDKITSLQKELKRTRDILKVYQIMNEEGEIEVIQCRSSECDALLGDHESYYATVNCDSMKKCRHVITIFVVNILLIINVQKSDLL